MRRPHEAPVVFSPNAEVLLSGEEVQQLTTLRNAPFLNEVMQIMPL